MVSSGNLPTLILVSVLCISIVTPLEARISPRNSVISGGGGTALPNAATDLSTTASKTAPNSSFNGTAHCPVDSLKLGWCADVLSGLVHETLGDPNEHKCCPILDGLLGFEAAACLCSTIHLKVLDINVALPIALELLVECGKQPPTGFKCLSH